MSEIVVPSGGGYAEPIASSTLFTLINRVKRHLYTGYREELNRLASTVSPTVATIPTEFALQSLVRGAKLSIDLEDMYVWGSTGQDISVQRGFFGSKASEHLAGAIITINPKFSDAEIHRALEEEVLDLSSPGALYQVKSTILIANTAVRAYDFPVPTFTSIYRIYARAHAVNKIWVEIEDWEVNRAANTADFPSGISLSFHSPVATGQEIRVLYKTGFNAIGSDLTADVATTTGIPATAIDILPIGAAIGLTLGREIKRNFTEVQGDTRRAEEVPPGANLNSSRGLMMWRQNRITDEAFKLSRQYPTKLPKSPMKISDYRR